MKRAFISGIRQAKQWGQFGLGLFLLAGLLIAVASSDYPSQEEMSVFTTLLATCFGLLVGLLIIGFICGFCADRFRNLVTDYDGRMKVVE